MQLAHRLAGRAEDDGGAGIEEAQDVDGGQFHLAGGDADGAVVDVASGGIPCPDGQAQGVGLVGGGHVDDGARQGGGEQQGAAGLGRGVEDFLEFLLEAEIEHLVGFVEHDGAQGAEAKGAALQVIAQAPGRSDDDVAAVIQRPALGAGVHAADAGDDARAGEQPLQFGLHLHGQFARGGDDQGGRSPGRDQGLVGRQQGFGEQQAIGHGLARAGAGRDQQVAPRGVGLEHRRLDGGQGRIATGGERRGQRRVDRLGEHGAAFSR